MNKEFPAFPSADGKEPGMTLRDYFAAKVLEGYWANPESSMKNEELAKSAYAAADALLAERLKR